MDLHTPIRDYIHALEEERKKILVFQRELPLCLDLITHAIENGKQQIEGESEETIRMTETPVLEEFIPLKPAASSSGSHHSDNKPSEEGEKPDWLRSVQLWNQDPDPLPNRVVPQKPIAVNARKLGGAFRPFEKEKVKPAATSSTVETTGVVEKDKEFEGQSESNRKARRCWSPELHRRFLHALQQLGGSHAATPKQIRELMKVDSLTNDEVKSHLQKYRLHTRRSAPAVQGSRSESPQSPHFVVVGGTWVTTSVAAAGATTLARSDVPDAPRNEICSPVSSLPEEYRSEVYREQKKQSTKRPPCSGRGSQDGSSLGDYGATHSASRTCSSSQTITAS